MNTKKIVLGLGAVMLSMTSVWAGGPGPWGHHPGRPDVVVIERHDPGRHYGWDRRPVTVVRERTVVYRDWAPPPRVVEYRYARPYYEPGVTIDVSPIFIPFR
jgi:hypothetical protein